MANIFGKEFHDYRHLADQAVIGGQMNDAAVRKVLDGIKQSTGQTIDFQALDAMRSLGYMNMSDTELFTQAFGFVTNNLQSIQAEIEEILYLESRFDEWLPVATNIPEGAQTYSYRVVDRHGQGKFINREGTEAGNATASVGLVPYAIGYGGINASWTLEDLRATMFAGVSIDSETIRAAMDGCMDHIEQVAIDGDINGTGGSYGFRGITNLNGVTTTNASKTIATMSGDELVSFVQTQVGALIEATNTIFPRRIGRMLALYLPTAQFNIVSTLPYGDNRDKTAWEFVRMYNPWTERTGMPLELREVIELDQAGVANADRMIVGFPDEPRVWEMALPIAPRVITTNNMGFTVNAPIEYKVSGVNLKRPAGVRYVDGI